MIRFGIERHAILGAEALGGGLFVDNKLIAYVSKVENVSQEEFEDLLGRLAQLVTASA